MTTTKDWPEVIRAKTEDDHDLRRWMLRENRGDYVWRPGPYSPYGPDDMPLWHAAECGTLHGAHMEDWPTGTYRDVVRALMEERELDRAGFRSTGFCANCVVREI